MPLRQLVLGIFPRHAAVGEVDELRVDEGDMLRHLRTLVVGLTMLAAALAGCGGPKGQYSAEEDCRRSGGLYRGGFCEKPVQGY